VRLKAANTPALCGGSSSSFAFKGTQSVFTDPQKGIIPPIEVH